jgi:hypothetical protein
MKIANPEIIRKGEQEFIKAIASNLDWGVIKEIFRKKHNLELEEAVKYKDAKINIHDNRMAFSLDFDVKVKLSVQLDREGNYISFESPGVVHKSSNGEDEHLEGEGLPEVDFAEPMDVDSEELEASVGNVERPVETGELISDGYEEALREIGSIDSA